MQHESSFISDRFDWDAADLFSKLLIYNKNKRIVAQPAMSHTYFRSLGSQVIHLDSGKLLLS